MTPVQKFQTVAQKKPFRIFAILYYSVKKMQGVSSGRGKKLEKGRVPGPNCNFGGVFLWPFHG
jgi:hypothetical protein